MRISKWAAGVCSMIVLSGLCSAQPVPSSYQDLFSTLQNDLSTFSGQIGESWDGTLSPVIFS